MTDEIRLLLAAHTAKYPGMEPTDAVKLLYQRRFGGGHLIRDPSYSLQRLREEYEATEKTDKPLCEDIGGGVVRLYLGGLRPEWLEKVNEAFVRSAERIHGQMPDFLCDLRQLEETAEEGVLPFTAAALADYLSGYRAAGCPMVSHSPRYRELYAPAYRVMCADEAEHLMRAMDKTR